MLKRYGKEAGTFFKQETKLTTREQAVALCDGKIDAFIWVTAVGAAAAVGKKDETCEKRLLDSTGLDLEADGDRWLVSDVRLNSHAQTAGVDLDWEIVWAKLQADRFAKQWFYVSAAGLFCLIFILQSRRSRRQNDVNQGVQKQTGKALTS